MSTQKTKIDTSRVLIGSDFELFIKDISGKFISAIPFIEGTKDEPLAVSEKGHAIQADGVLFEANVPPVTLKHRDQMWEDIQFVISEGKDRLPEELSIVCCPNGNYEDDQLDDPKARQAGCDPDFSAWEGGNSNPKPDITKNNKRCCGFHFHISFPGAAPKNVMRLIRILDVNLGLPFVLLDEDRERRKLYGKAGCFRYKDYGGNVGGVEYRTLSNAVIKTKETFDYAFQQLAKSIDDYNKGLDFLEHKDRILEAINNYNLDLVEELCEEFEVLVLKQLA